MRDEDMMKYKDDNSLKIWAIIFGVIFLAIGILGFVPQALTGDNLLLGLFRVNTPHNIIHLASGVAALLCGLYSTCASRLYFQIFGIVYALVAAIGLYYQNHDLFGVIGHNVHDIWLHAVIAIVALYLGFFFHRSCGKSGTCDHCDK